MTDKNDQDQNQDQQNQQDRDFRVIENTEFNETRSNAAKAKQQLQELMNNFDAMSILLEYRSKCAKTHFNALVKEGFNEQQAIQIVINTKY